MPLAPRFGCVASTVVGTAATRIPLSTLALMLTAGPPC